LRALPLGLLSLASLACYHPFYNTMLVTSYRNGVNVSSKAIVSFSISPYPAVGLISEPVRAISITLPHLTPVTALSPTIGQTGASVQPPSGVARDFTSSVRYTVTAIDQTTQVYTASVSLVASAANPPAIFTPSPGLQQVSSVQPPPKGITADYPSGLGGSGNAVFSLIVDGYLYYQDRDYTIAPLALSPNNTTTFAALGFEGAMGISTQDGVLGPPADPLHLHKYYTGNNYITFTALRDLDVYVMYDTRGGINRFDDSQDTPWLAAYGFTTTFAGPHYFVETTDAVGLYKVYKKTYLAGSTVELDGNYKGLAPPPPVTSNINTNYWVIIKCRNDLAANSAARVIVTPSDTTPPAEVGSLTANAAHDGINLSWTPPPNPDFTNVLITYYFATALPPYPPPYIVAKGIDSVNIGALSDGTAYIFKIQTQDSSNNLSTGTTVTVTPAPNTNRHVAYSGNGNTGGSPPVDAASYATGSSVITVLANSGSLQKTGFVFKGWNDQADGGGNNYAPGDSFTCGAIDETLYAWWLHP